MTSSYVNEEGYADREVLGARLPHLLRPRIEKCVREVVSKTGPCDRVFTYCDFGSSDGLSSSVIASTVASEISRTGGPKELSVVLEDQQENDFRPAFARVTQSLTGVDIDAVVSAVGRSFFDQCLPTESLHFGTSNYALMNLDTSRRLEDFSTGYPSRVLRRHWDVQRDLSFLTEAERAQIAATTEKAAEDWVRFLLCRAKELCSGGRLLLASNATVPRDSPYFQKYAGSAERGLDEQMEPLAKAVDDLIAAGEIGEEEAANFIIPGHHRTLEEATAPFMTPGSPVQQAGLTLLSSDLIVVEYPEPVGDVQLLSQEEVKQHASEFRSTVQSYTSPVIRCPLALKAERNEKEVDRLVKLVFDKFEETLVARKRFKWGQFVYLLDIEKQ